VVEKFTAVGRHLSSNRTPSSAFRILLPLNRVFVRLVLIRLSFGHFELPKCAARHSNRGKSQETRVKANRLRYPSKQAIAKDSSKPNAGLHRAL
jgi:hypothetical protein